jgi:hypothetical protein
MEDDAEIKIQAQNDEQIKNLEAINLGDPSPISITLELPAFTIVAGQSKQGKTYFVFQSVIPEALKHGYEIHWIVNKHFMVEPPIAQQALKHEDYYIHVTGDLGRETISKMIKRIKETETKKLILIDNFSFDRKQGVEFLNFVTFARKYNASVMFLGHSLFNDPKIAPRLREMVMYMFLFFIPMNDSYKKILGESKFQTYLTNIQARRYKFLFFDLSGGDALIGKYPGVKLTIKTDDQFKGLDRKMVDALKKINEEMDDHEGPKQLPDSKSQPINLTVGNGAKKPKGKKALQKELEQSMGSMPSSLEDFKKIKKVDY